MAIFPVKESKLAALVLLLADGINPLDDTAVYWQLSKVTPLEHLTGVQAI